jgi:hypothetical protein
MKAIKSALVIATLAISGAAFAGPLDGGMVGGQVTSDVKLKKVNLDNKTTVGYAKQELNVGSVNGAKVLGNVKLNVKADDITMKNKSTVGYASQEANIGSIK